MNFEEAYEKYKAGTATDEEKAFVEAEIEKAKKVSALLELQPSETVLEQADEDTYKKAKKSFMRKSTVKIIVIVLCCIVGVSALVCGSVFGVSFYSASNASALTEDDAILAAKQCVADNYGVDIGTLIHTEVEKELDMSYKLTKSRYVYDIEIQSANCQYEVKVKSDSGFAYIVDVDMEDDDYEDRKEQNEGDRNDHSHTEDRNDKDD